MYEIFAIYGYYATTMRMIVNLIDIGKEMVMPGDDASLILTLKSEMPLELNQRFTLREGTKTVGTGVVTEIIA